MQKLLTHLREQLRGQGIDSPEDLVIDGPTELAERYWGAVSGGFGQLGFGQIFNMTSIPGGFGLTTFAQDIRAPHPQVAK
jgi:hypothetical protein